ncbi:family 43 glycosylhydrolase [Melissococcus plutonius]|uniref:glycoside hydrolase family 43 protein n=1 Tax=Melissococcus plutonius TaxID=33970 RepID=UPI003C2C86CF
MVTQYQNPILRGMYPDPSIVRVEDTYYLVNSTFEYYPGIALSKSTDLLNWTKLEGIATLPSQADLRAAKSNEGIFAVCIRYYQEHFYVITTNFSEFKTFILRDRLTADKKTIEWQQDRVEVAISGIDPDLYFEDNHTYLQFTGYIDDKGTKAIQQVEIDIKTGNLIQKPKIISFGTGGRDVEGPHIIKKDGWYYLLIAEGGTGVGHMITMQRSRSLWGPFEAEAGINPLFTNRDRAEQPLQNIGHADLFQDTKGNWWLTCLGTHPSNVGFTLLTNTGRETLLYPVNWEKDWPVIYTGIPERSVDLTKFPAHADILTQEQNLTPFIDQFIEQRLSPEWITLRDQLVEELTIDKNCCLLKGKNETLSDLKTPAFIGIRQTEQEEIFQVTLSKEKTAIQNGQIGIAALINADHYAALLLEKNETLGYTVRHYQKVADLEINEAIGQLSELPDTLTIINHQATKTFLAENKKSDEQLSFTTSALHFSNEAIAALNTGDVEGIYAYNNAQIAIIKAERSSL